jgi:hypothetical protein
VRWTVRRSFFQDEADALLMALSRYQGRMPPDLALRLEVPRQVAPSGSRPRGARTSDVCQWHATSLVADIADRGLRRRHGAARDDQETVRLKEPPSRQPPQLLRLLDRAHLHRPQFQGSWRTPAENHPI